MLSFIVLALFEIHGVTITGLRHPSAQPPLADGAKPPLAFYPPSAQSKGLAGEATVQCAIKIGGMLSQCLLISEDPIGEGFGEKAVMIGSMLDMHKLKPSIDWNNISEGAQARVPFHFVLKDNTE